MIRIIGVISFSLSFVIYGIGLQREYSNKRAQENAFMLLMEHIKARISTSSAPLDEILCEFKNSTLEKLGMTNGPHNPNERLQFFEKNKDKLLLDSEEIALLSDFFEGIGKCVYTAECDRICQKYTELFKNHIQEKNEKDKNKTELKAKMCFLAAAAVFVIMI